MPSYIKILQPQAGTNLVVNPSVEINTNRWFTFGSSSIAQSSAFQAKGAYSLAVTPTVGLTDGTLFFPVASLAPTEHTASVWVRGVAGVPYRIYFATTVPVIVGTPTQFTGTGQWQYVTVTATTTPVQHYIIIAKNNSASTGIFYVDGLQIETGSIATTYIDGDQDGCYWTGEPHNSTSARIANDTNGGRWLDLADDLQHNLIEFQGMGMPPVQVAAQTYALLPGAFYQRSIARPRLMQLAVLASGTSWQNLHFRRNLLLEAIQPSRSGMPQPITLRYDGAGSVNTIRAVYDSGMEFGRRDGFTETYGLRMVAHDPYWYGEQDESGTLVGQGTFRADWIAQRNPVTGQWGSVGVAGGVNNSVLALAEWNGSVYAGGAFTTVDGTANANRIAVFSNNQWGTTVGGGLNGTAFALAVNASGTVYAAGTFSTAGGTTVGRIATWRPNNTWGTLVAGIAGGGTRVRALAISPDGTVYVGGTFTSAGGTTAANIAFVYGGGQGTWGTLTNGVNGEVLALAVSLTGTVYAGGQFTTANGTTANYIAYWDKNNWGTMAGGIDTIVRDVVVGRDGFVYIANLFRTPSLTQSAYRAAQWNGQSWQSLNLGSAYAPSGVEGAVKMAFNQNNRLYTTGFWYSNLNEAIGGDVVELASWSSNTWREESALFNVFTPGEGNQVQSIVFRNDQTLFVGGPFSTTGVVAGQSIIIGNPGSAPAEPIIRIRGTGDTTAVKSIVNWTTNQSILLNLVVNNGEIIYIDTRAGNVRIFSTWRGNIISSLQSGSELASFNIAPGVNNYLTAFVFRSNTATIDLYFRTRNWSADAV